MIESRSDLDLIKFWKPPRGGCTLIVGFVIESHFDIFPDDDDDDDGE